MAEKLRKYAIDFFTGQLGPANHNVSLSTFLRHLTQTGCHHVEGLTYDIEIRNLHEQDPGVFQGVFAKIRKDELLMPAALDTPTENWDSPTMKVWSTRTTSSISRK